MCGDYSVNTGFDTVHKPIHQDVYTVLMVEKKSCIMEDFMTFW